jgi:hypothetical protein
MCIKLRLSTFGLNPTTHRSALTVPPVRPRCRRPGLSCHAIFHGTDLDYGREVISRTASI